MTVDEVPSGIYLYPEEESETDKILTPPSTRYSSDLFEEGKKDILKLMGIEVCFFFFLVLLFLLIHKRQRPILFSFPRDHQDAKTLGLLESTSDCSATTF